MYDDLFTLGGLIIAILGFAFGGWKWTETRIERTRTETLKKAAEARDVADTARNELSAYRTHVAETYVSKQGHREATEQIMGAIDGVKRAVDGMTLRVDRIVDARQPRSRGT